MRRLVLGCGIVGRSVAESVMDWSGDLIVIETNPRRVETLRDEGVAAERADPTDPSVLSGFDPVDLAFVASDDPTTNLAAAEAVRDALPEAYLVVYSGRDPTPAERAEIDAVADRVVDRAQAFATSILKDFDAEAGDRLQSLSSALRGIDGKLGVFMHDNPDPDAIGSAIALRDLAEGMGTDADTCYFGEISHQENQALVNLLDLDLRRLAPGDFDPGEYDGIALVDHSRPGVNDQLPPETPVDVVIDHHPPREPVTAEFVDLRSDVGATSTLLSDYYRRFGAVPSSTVATALLFGIRVDTNDFEREVTETDFEAAAYLLSHADVDVLERVENPQVSPETLDTLGRAIRKRKRKGAVLISGVGSIGDRDAIAQAADQLLDMEGVTTTLVYGIADGTVYASARTRGTNLDIGETMRQAFGRIGAAGGHTDMAGAQLSLGILADVDEDDEALETVIDDVISNRFFEVVGLRRVLDVLDVDVGPR